MNSKEREQLIVFNELKKEEISQKEAANKLKVSDRWVRKKFKRFIGEGAAGARKAGLKPLVVGECIAKKSE